MPHFYIVDEFAPQAVGLRAAYDHHFAHPELHRLDTHGCWNYWYLPGLYTYLRADAIRVLDRALLGAFMERLRAWSVANLGCDHLTEPTLSLYVNGCRQGPHNDAENGRWAYVLSLTLPARRFTGGGTMLFKPNPYWNTPAASRAMAGRTIYDIITPEFNRLVVFDDRLIHAVEPVEGSMNPVEGRVVLHGHIREGEPWLSGALASMDRAAVISSIAQVRGRCQPLAQSYRGLITLRLSVGPDGLVKDATVLSDLATPREHVSVSNPGEAAAHTALGVRFPEARGESQIVVPLSLDSTPW